MVSLWANFIWSNVLYYNCKSKGNLHKIIAQQVPKQERKTGLFAPCHIAAKKPIVWVPEVIPELLTAIRPPFQIPLSRISLLF